MNVNLLRKRACATAAPPLLAISLAVPALMSGNPQLVEERRAVEQPCRGGAGPGDVRFVVGLLPSRGSTVVRTRDDAMTLAADRDSKNAVLDLAGTEGGIFGPEAGGMRCFDCWVGPPRPARGDAVLSNGKVTKSVGEGTAASHESAAPLWWGVGVATVVAAVAGTVVWHSGRRETRVDRVRGTDRAEEQ